MMAFPKYNARALVVVAAAAIAFVAGCADRSMPSDIGGACLDDGEWDYDTWCQYPIYQIENRHGLSGTPVAVVAPVPEGGCGACDGDLINLLIEDRIAEKCPDGIIEFEPGCRKLRDDLGPDVGQMCGYMVFVWGESCSGGAEWMLQSMKAER